MYLYYKAISAVNFWHLNKIFNKNFFYGIIGPTRRINRMLNLLIKYSFMVMIFYRLNIS